MRNRIGIFACAVAIGGGVVGVAAYDTPDKTTASEIEGVTTLPGAGSGETAGDQHHE